MRCLLSAAFFGLPDFIRPLGNVEFVEKIRDAQGNVHELDFQLDDPLSRLDLAGYAAELEAQGLGKRYLQICQIKDEVNFISFGKEISSFML